MSDLYEEDLQFERDLRYIPNLNENENRYQGYFLSIRKGTPC
jgi:hypothetical protein